MKGARPWRQWRRIFGPHPDQEVDEELKFHLEQRTREYIAQGMSPESARRAAAEKFGDVTRVRETCTSMLAADRSAEARPAADAPNPVWFKPVMFGFMLLGLAWIIVFYVSQGRLPIADLGSWNILIGFGIAFVGFLMTTRWR